MIFEIESHKEIFEKYKNMDFGNLVKFSKLTEKYRKQAVFSYANQVNTGFPTLDKSLFGIKPGEVVYIISPTNVGKTAFALNLIKNNLTDKSLILFFSLENNEYQMYERMLTMELSVPAWVIEERFAKGDMKFIQQSEEVSQKWDCVVNIVERVNISDIVPIIKTVEEIRRLKTKFVVIDYLQLIKSLGMNEYARISESSQIIKEISLKLNLPVIVLSQVSRSEAKNEDGLNLYSAKGSGEIENSAQILFGLDRKKNIPAEHSALQRLRDERHIDILELKTLKKKRGYYVDVLLKLDYSNMTLTEINSYKQETF